MGSNGLPPIPRIGPEPCPDTPSKTIYTTSAAAWRAADERSGQVGARIAPYACSGCGYYHLTRKVNGSDVLTRQPGSSVVTGAMRNIANSRRSPEVGGNHPAVRSKAAPAPRPLSEQLAEDLDARDRPTTAELTVRYGVTQAALFSAMHAIGWTPGRGRGARWTPPAPSLSSVPPLPSPAKPGWRDVEVDRIGHVALGDLVETLRASGVKVRVQVSDG